MGLCNDAGRRTGKTIDSPEAKAILNNQGVCNLQKKMGEFHTKKVIFKVTYFTDGPKMSKNL